MRPRPRTKKREPVEPVPDKPKRKHTKPKPRTRKGTQESPIRPRGTPMNGLKGISLNTPGFPLDEPTPEINTDSQVYTVSQVGTRPHPLMQGNFKTRKMNAMRKRGLNFKGRPLGTSLNSLAIKFKVRKAQDQRNDQRNLTNQKTKKSIKGRITNRKKKSLEAILENVSRAKEHNKVFQELKEMEAKNSPGTIAAKDMNNIEETYKKEANFNNMFGETHNKQPLQMEGMEPEVAKELFKATKKAEMYDYKTIKNEAKKYKPQTKPKKNTDVPDFRGELAKP